MEYGLLNECTTPTPRGAEWLEKHNEHRFQCKGSNYKVALLGDSFMANISKSEIWPKFEDLSCLNLGIGGDKIENVLYRIKNGNLDEGRFQVIVFLAGSGNCNNGAGKIFQGILECVNSIHDVLPDVDIILTTMLPRGKYENPKRKVLKEVSDLIRKLRSEEFAMLMVMKPERIHVVEIDKNIISDGKISHEIMYDYLHLTDAGHLMCFKPVYDKIVELLS